MAIAVVTKFHGATNTKGARISVESNLMGVGRKYYSYDYAARDPHLSAFREYLGALNEMEAARLGTEAPLEGYYQYVDEASSLDGTGTIYFIK